MRTSRRGFVAGASAFAVLGTKSAFAQKKYDDGATDKEIKIGHTGPYSGPASSYGQIGKTIEAFFKSVNEAGGVNGRKINFITRDDGYSPPKMVELVRQLVDRLRTLGYKGPDFGHSDPGLQESKLIVLEAPEEFTAFAKSRGWKNLAEDFDE